MGFLFLHKNNTCFSGCEEKISSILYLYLGHMNRGVAKINVTEFLFKEPGKFVRKNFVLTILYV